MVHFRIHFSYPLLLLVFLFGAVMTALLYFRLSKKYRKNRNRITSIVLHLIVLALAALTLAGTMFTYEIPNKENQIILLVDVSDTTEQSARERERAAACWRWTPAGVNRHGAAATRGICGPHEPVWKGIRTGSFSFAGRKMRPP